MPCSSTGRGDPGPPEGGRLARLSEADLDQVLRIERDSFANPWRREHFLSEIRDNAWAVNHVIRRGPQVLAYACVWQIHGELRINNIAVHPGHRRQGLGRWLLGQCLEHARRAGCSVARLEVRPSNSGAIALYRDHGFTEVGRRKGYYRPEGEDAILMEAPL